MTFLERLWRSPILNAWFHHGVKILMAILAIPIALANLSAEEVNVWLLFTTATAMGQGVIFGFNVTFVRFFSYTYSGVDIREFRTIKSKFVESYSNECNYLQMGYLFKMMGVIFIFLAIIYFVTLLVLGTWMLYKPIMALQNYSVGWLLWLFVLTATTIIVYLSMYQILLEGINDVALVHRVGGIVNTFGLVATLLVLWLHTSLINLIVAYQVTALVAALALLASVHWFRGNLLGKIKGGQLKKEVFTVLWESTWKSGITTIMANIIKHVSGVIVAQLFPPVQSASFLLTKRFFDVVDSFTMISFQAKAPEIARLRGRGDISSLILLLRKVQYICYAIFLIGVSTILFSSDIILNAIGSEVSIATYDLLLLFSVAHLLSRWGGINLSISNQANHIIEHISSAIFFVLYFMSIYFLYGTLGLNVFPAAVIFSCMVTMPFIASITYKTFGTNFLAFEKKVFLPVVGALFVINLVYVVTYV